MYYTVFYCIVCIKLYYVLLTMHLHGGFLEVSVTVYVTSEHRAAGMVRYRSLRRGLLFSVGGCRQVAHCRVIITHCLAIITQPNPIALWLCPEIRRGVQHPHGASGESPGRVRTGDFPYKR